MRFALSPDQEALADIARRFATTLPGPAEPRDDGAWRRIVEEQGWQALVIPEAYGGFGFGPIELCVVLGETGRRLHPGPLLATSWATALILEAGDEEARGRFLPELAAGTTGALAFGGRAIEGRVVGEAKHVVDGLTASIVVVVTPEGAFVAEPVERVAEVALDSTRALATLRFDGPAVQLPGDLAAGLERAWAALAAEAVGSAEAILDRAVEYAKVRHQFGKPIGSFQAIKHKCADLLLDVESSRSAAWYAAWAIASGAADRHLAARTAKAFCTDALFRCAAENIQIHGGIGFTWEHDAHLFFKRARGSQSLLGHPREHRAAIADLVL